MLTLIDGNVKFPKEANEVMSLLVDVAKTVRQGGDYTLLLGDLVKAIDGIGTVGDELSQEKWDLVRCVTCRAVDIAEALTAPKLITV